MSGLRCEIRLWFVDRLVSWAHRLDPQRFKGHERVLAPLVFGRNWTTVLERAQAGQTWLRVASLDALRPWSVLRNGRTGEMMLVRALATNRARQASIEVRRGVRTYAYEIYKGDELTVVGSAEPGPSGGRDGRDEVAL